MSRESWDLILADLFLWMALIFAVLSAREIANPTSFFVLVFFAFFIASSNLPKAILLIDCFLKDPRNALFAVFVTGMLVV